MDGSSTFGITVRDIVLGVVTLLVSAMTWIFNNHDKRISELEKHKVDLKAHENRFTEVLRRLDRQDEAAVLRDQKLDRLIERLIK